MKTSFFNPSGLSPAWRPAKELPKERRFARVITLTPRNTSTVIDISREEEVCVSLAGQHYLLSRDGTKIRGRNVLDDFYSSSEKVLLDSLLVETLPSNEFAVRISVRLNSANEPGPETEKTIRAHLKNAQPYFEVSLGKDRTKASVVLLEDRVAEIIDDEASFRACLWKAEGLLFAAKSQAFHSAERGEELVLGGLRFRAIEMQAGRLGLRIEKNALPPSQARRIVLTASYQSERVRLCVDEEVFVDIDEERYLVNKKSNGIVIYDLKHKSSVFVRPEQCKELSGLIIRKAFGKLLVTEEGMSFRLTKLPDYPV